MRIILIQWQMSTALIRVFKRRTYYLSSLPFQKSTCNPRKSFHKLQVFTQVALPCPQVPCCFHSLCSLSWLLIALPCQYNANLAFTSQLLEQSWLSQLAPLTLSCRSSPWPLPHTTTYSVCSLTVLASWKSWEKKGNLGYRFSVAQCRSFTLLFHQNRLSQGSYLLFCTEGLDGSIYFFSD